MPNLNELLNTLVPLTKEQEQSLYIYYQELIESSKVINLTTCLLYTSDAADD